MNESSSEKRTTSPLGPTIKSGRFFDLPFTEENADIILLPVPWDVTVSFRDGTSTGPLNILESSYYQEIWDRESPDAKPLGIHLLPASEYWLERNKKLRKSAKQYIEFLSNGGNVEENEEMIAILEEINTGCDQLRQWVLETTSGYLAKGKLVGLVGGEHSIPLGYLQALASRHQDFGILQIDAHQDLIECYEGFEYSHASIFYNTLKMQQVSKLVQVGIRDVCAEETAFVQNAGGRVKVFYDQEMRESIFRGGHFDQMADGIISELPKKVYISFDIDGLEPQNCPNTGTPVPGGLQFQEALYLVKKVAASGRQIIGFDLCEVAGLGNDWDGNVGARMLLHLTNCMGRSV